VILHQEHWNGLLRYCKTIENPTGTLCKMEVYHFQSIRGFPGPTEEDYFVLLDFLVCSFNRRVIYQSKATIEYTLDFSRFVLHGQNISIKNRRRIVDCACFANHHYYYSFERKRLLMIGLTKR
jgi:hypothetical protein